MSGQSYIHHVISELWPQDQTAAAPVWAILDSAIDERILGKIEASGLDFGSVFPGRLAPEMKAAIPYLVRVRPGHSFVDYIIAEGWDRHWGVFLQADAAMEALRFHLKKLMRVQDEDGHRLFFRYYDPRVLRVYLPTCTIHELSLFYGPVSRYLMEDEDPGNLIEFAFHDRELRERKVILGDRAAWQLSS